MLFFIKLKVLSHFSTRESDVITRYPVSLQKWHTVDIYWKFGKAYKTVDLKVRQDDNSIHSIEQNIIAH